MRVETSSAKPDSRKFSATTPATTIAAPPSQPYCQSKLIPGISTATTRIASACTVPITTAASDFPSRIVRASCGDASSVRSRPLSRSR